MKKIFFFLLTLSVIIFIACNNGGNKNEKGAQDMNTMKKDSVQPMITTDEKDVKAVEVTYTKIDAKAAASINGIVDHYLHIKNALINDNGDDASNGAKAMTATMRELDKSLLTNEQKKVYDQIEDDLKEHAEHIAKNGDNIKHEREHFSMMSDDVYDLVKAFGGGLSLYHDYCPMYNDNKGASWLSETKEIRNPYFGKKMMTCGRVEDMFRQ